MRTETEQKEFVAREKQAQREIRLYYPAESKAIDDQIGDYVYYHALDEARQKFVVQDETLGVDLIRRVYADDRLLSKREFEQRYAAGVR
jgi:hypothetical protein